MEHRELRQERIKTYEASYHDDVFSIGNCISEIVRTYNSNSELLEDVDIPTNPEKGGQRDIYSYHKDENGGRIIEKSIYSLACDEIEKECLYKRYIDHFAANGNLIESSEYDVDELVYHEVYLYDQLNNNIENHCEYYEDGELSHVVVVKSAFDEKKRETFRVTYNVGLWNYKQYLKNGGNLSLGDEVEHFEFEYNHDDYLTKEVYSSSEGVQNTHSMIYDNENRLIKEIWLSPERPVYMTKYEYGEGDLVAHESSFEDDKMMQEVFRNVDGAEDSPKSVYYIRTETADNSECRVQIIERVFF